MIYGSLAGALLGGGWRLWVGRSLTLCLVVSFAGMRRIVPICLGCKTQEKRVSYVGEAGHDEEEFSWST